MRWATFATSVILNWHIKQIPMVKSSEDIVLDFLKLLGFPGIRRGENNSEVCSYLKDMDYRFTPDLVAGPPDIKDAKIEGLFFIDVIQPTSDLLFISKFYEDYEVNVPNEFKKILLDANNDVVPCSIDSIPNSHHQCYLDSINKKLDKYAHKRQFKKQNKGFVSANVGIVHHFNLEGLRGDNLSEIKKVITVLDYIRFYKRLSLSDNIDLKNAENDILNEIVNEDQNDPYLLMVGREWDDLPCLFLMLHISIIKRSKRKSLALLMLNTTHLDNSDEKYPVHNWFKDRIFHPRTFKQLNSEFKEKKITINISADKKIFT